MVYGKDIKEEIMYARLLSLYGNRMDMINIDKKYTIPRSLHDISPIDDLPPWRELRKNNYLIQIYYCKTCL